MIWWEFSAWGAEGFGCDGCCDSAGERCGCPEELSGAEYFDLGEVWLGVVVIDLVVVMERVCPSFWHVCDCFACVCGL